MDLYCRTEDFLILAYKQEQDISDTKVLNIHNISVFLCSWSLVSIRPRSEQKKSFFRQNIQPEWIYTTNIELNTRIYRFGIFIELLKCWGSHFKAIQNSKSFSISKPKHFLGFVLQFVSVAYSTTQVEAYFKIVHCTLCTSKN